MGLTSNEFWYAVEKIKLLRKYHQAGQLKKMREEKDKLEEFLNERRCYLVEDEKWLYKVRAFW